MCGENIVSVEHSIHAVRMRIVPFTSPVNGGTNLASCPSHLSIKLGFNALDAVRSVLRRLLFLRGLDRVGIIKRRRETRRLARRHVAGQNFKADRLMGCTLRTRSR